MAKESNLIYGLRPVIEALNSNQQIDRILIQNGLQGNLAGELRALIRQKNVPTQIVPVEKLNHLVQGNHQGIVATIAAIAYRPVIDILEELAQRNNHTPLLLLLDHITDVRNMGAIVRTAECANVDAVIIPDHGSARLSEDAVKTSSGALLRLPICRESNLKTVINLMHQYGYQVVASTEKGATTYTDVDFRQPTLVIMGAEETGISNDLLRLADQRAAIPIRGDIQSLNVSVATGIMLYEALRQRNS